MQKINFKQQVLPHLIAISVFLAITILFFQPALFDGKSLNQSDIVQWEASAQELINYRAETSEEGLWTNSIFGGMPAYLISVKWGNQLIKVAHAVYTLGLPHPVRIVFASLLSFYIMLLCFGVRPYLAIIGAVAFGVSSYNIIGLTAGHNARISALSFVPLVMGAVHLCFHKNKWLGASLTALALAMQLRVNHLQITYYLAFIIIIYGVVMLVNAYREGKIKWFVERTGILVIAAILAIGTFFGEFYATYEYGKYSNRGKSELTQQTNPELNADGLSKDYAFQYSNGMWDPFTLFIPNALGGNGPFPDNGDLAKILQTSGANAVQIQQYLRGVPTYWGSESPTTYYAGAIMFFLSILALFIVDKKYSIWLIAVAILGIVLSYGRNLAGFNNFMFDIFPGYNKFRSVTFTMLMPIFAFGLLGSLALEKLMDLEFTKKLKKQLLIAFSLSGGLALLLTLGSGMFSYSAAIDGQLQAQIVEAVQSDRQSLFQADALRTFGFILVFAILLYLLLTGKVAKQTVIIGLIVVGIADSTLVSSRFISEDNFSTNYRTQSFVKTPADQYIERNEALGDRVLDLTSSFYNARASYHHNTVNGYHGARVRRYQEMMDAAIISEYSNAIQVVQSGRKDFSSFPMLNMLNTKFLIFNPSSPQGAVINQSANGSAWFVNELIFASNADGEFNSTKNLSDTKNKAVVNLNEVSESTGLSTNGSIRLTEYHPGYWKYQTNNSGEGFAVFSEVYYPKGFEVTIDGESVEMTKANYILRGLVVPGGQHTIEFKFTPKIYTSGSLIMTIMSILVIGGFFFSVYLSLKKD